MVQNSDAVQFGFLLTASHTAQGDRDVGGGEGETEKSRRRLKSKQEARNNSPKNNNRIERKTK